MMMIPRKRNEFDIWDDMFRGDPFFSEKNTAKIMKTDIKDKGDNYIIDMDLPGYEKDNIEISMEEGYLTVSAKVSEDNNEEEENYIRKERYFGECSRSFYVGEDVHEEDIKASFKNGKLTLTVPKEEKKKIESKKLIQID